MEVRRKPNESTGSLLRRFSRLAQQTKIVARAKGRTAFKKKTTQREERNRAIMKVQLRAVRRKLDRMGIHDDDAFEEEKRKVKQTLGL